MIIVVCIVGYNIKSTTCKPNSAIFFETQLNWCMISTNLKKYSDLISLQRVIDDFAFGFELSVTYAFYILLTPNL